MWRRKPTIYDNWIGSGANRQSQRPVRHQDRPPLQRKESFERASIPQQWTSTVAYNCFNNFADPCAGGPNKSDAHLLTFNDTHTFNPTLLLTTTLGLHARSRANQRL